MEKSDSIVEVFSSESEGEDEDDEDDGCSSSEIQEEQLSSQHAEEVEDGYKEEEEEDVFGFQKQNSFYDQRELQSQEICQPGLNRFMSIVAPMPVRREQSFGYLYAENVAETEENDNIYPPRDYISYARVDRRHNQELPAPPSIAKPSKRIRSVEDSHLKHSATPTVVCLKKQIRRLVTQNHGLSIAASEAQLRYTQAATGLGKVSKDLSKVNEKISELSRQVAEESIARTKAEGERDYYFKKAQLQVEESAKKGALHPSKIVEDSSSVITSPVTTQELREDILSVLNCATRNSQQYLQVIASKDSELSAMSQQLATARALIDNLSRENSEVEVLRENAREISSLLVSREAEITELKHSQAESQRSLERFPKLVEELESAQNQLQRNHALLIEQQVLHEIQKEAMRKEKQKLQKADRHASSVSEVFECFIEKKAAAAAAATEPQRLATAVLEDLFQVSFKDSGIPGKYLLVPQMRTRQCEEESSAVEIDIVGADYLNDSQQPHRLVFANQPAMLDTAREVLEMLTDNQSHLASLATCVDNFWLLAAVSLKAYLHEQDQQQAETQEEDNYGLSQHDDEEGEEEQQLINEGCSQVEEEAVDENSMDFA